MRINKLIILLLVGVLSFIKLNAQEVDENQYMLQQITASPFQLYYIQYEGTPFYSKDWMLASVKVNSGEIYQNIKVRIDLFKDDVIYYNENLHKQLIIDQEIVQEIYLRNEDENTNLRIVKRCWGKGFDETKCGLYFVLYDDRISLWSRHKKKVEQYNDVSKSSNILGKYYSVIKYYVVIKNKMLVIPKSKKKFAELFPNNKKEIVSYIKKNRLKLNNPKHLEILVKKLNELDI